MLFPGRRKCTLELLDVCNSNRDGRIGLSDFRRYVNAKERELYVFFQFIDVSRDGVIEAEEMRIALSSLAVAGSSPEVPLLIERQGMRLLSLDETLELHLRSEIRTGLCSIWSLRKVRM